MHGKTLMSTICCYLVKAVSGEKQVFLFSTPVSILSVFYKVAVRNEAISNASIS